jgi:hypothetical protein
MFFNNAIFYIIFLVFMMVIKSILTLYDDGELNPSLILFIGNENTFFILLKRSSNPFLYFYIVNKIIPK